MTFQALIFDVDGTLAETEEAHRRAFNETFGDFGLDWHWDRAVYADLLKVTGGKERIRDYVRDGGQEGGDHDVCDHQRFDDHRLPVASAPANRRSSAFICGRNRDRIGLEVSQ